MTPNALTFVLAAALFCAAGASAQGPASNANTNTNTSSDQSQAAPKAKDQKKQDWENGVKTDCAAEIATGGVCDGKDFGTGLEKCLHTNRQKLSDGCKAAVHPHKKSKKGAKKGGDEAPAATPATPPATTP